MPDGTEIDRASNLHSFQKKLATIPEESFLFHAENNHFSNWVMARSEIGLASRMYEMRIQDFESVDKLRKALIDQVNAVRIFRRKGGVAHFSERRFPDYQFAV